MDFVWVKILALIESIVHLYNNSTDKYTEAR